MTEPCRTECGKQVTYEKIIFSDGIFFSIPIEKSGIVHNCTNIQNAEWDLDEMDHSRLTEMSEDRGALNHEGRKKYRTAIEAIGYDVYLHLENKLGFEEDREEMRGTIGYYLGKTFVHVSNRMNRREIRDLPMMTRIVGKEFTYLELLGFLYQLDGFYADAKICFKFMAPQYADSPDAEEAWVKAHKAGDIPSEWGLTNSAIIDLIEERIEQQDEGKDGLKKIGGIWFDENWGDDLLDYFKEVRKNRSQGNYTKSSHQSQKSLTDDEISALKEEEKQIPDAYVRTKISEFEENDLRPVVRKQFPSEIEMIGELKKKKWGIGLNRKGLPNTLYDKAVKRQEKEEEDPLPAEDPMNVGLLRSLDIGDLVRMVDWPADIYRYLKDIEILRHKYAHPQQFSGYVLGLRKGICLNEIKICKEFFEKLLGR